MNKKQIINEAKRILKVELESIKTLNTSFNENEPIVLTPDHAIDCFIRTKMDYLVLNDYLVTK